MNILYFSVHAVLEYDEIRMFLGGGHSVFSLGSYFTGRRSQAFRPDLPFDAKHKEWMEAFTRLGGVFDSNNPMQSTIPPDFVALFDVCIVMHDPAVISGYWSALSRIPVIWRSIGVDIEGSESKIRPYRAKGCRIVRYSPREALAVDYLGEDAVIRFPKRLSDFVSNERTSDLILLFANNFASRYALEYQFYRDATAGLSAGVAGIGNEGMPDQLGFLTYEQQGSLLQSSSVYFYCAGSHIPYTLNFMEAWMSGIPVVALHPVAAYPPEKAKFAEIPALIEHGKSGFVVRDVDEAREILHRLVADPNLCRLVGREGRMRAQAFFEEAVVLQQWNTLLHSL